MQQIIYNFRRYNGIKDGYFEAVHTWEYYGGHGSAVALADVNGDHLLDVACGGWWNPSLIFLNDELGLPSAPSWYSDVTSVIEKIVFGDIGPTLTHQEEIKETFLSDGTQQLFYLMHQPIQYIMSVSCDGQKLSSDEFTYSREHGWFTINKNQVDEIEVVYTYSSSLDMIISNWDSGKGNFLYYNMKLFEDLDVVGNLVWSDVRPGSIVASHCILQNKGDPGSLLDWEIVSYPLWGTWTITPSNGDDLTPEQGEQIINISIVAPSDSNQEFTGELVIANKNNKKDVEIIDVSLVTLKNKNTIVFYEIENKHPFITEHPVLMRILQNIRTIWA